MQKVIYGLQSVGFNNGDNNLRNTLGRCECVCVCKKFEWTEKKKPKRTDRRGVVLLYGLSSPLSPRQQNPFHGLRNNAQETQNALWRNDAPSTRTTAVYRIYAFMMGTHE
jgi:hypothetical protein